MHSGYVVCDFFRFGIVRKNETVKQGLVEKSIQTFEMARINLANPIGTLYFKGEVPPRQLNEKIHLPSIHRSQVVETRIGKTTACLLVQLSHNKTFKLEARETTPFLHDRLENTIIETMDLRRLDQPLVFVSEPSGKNERLITQLKIPKVPLYRFCRYAYLSRYR